MTTVRDRVSVLDSAIAEITDRAARAAEHLASLDEKIERAERRLARGTFQGEEVVSPPAPEETKPARPRAKRGTITTPPPAPAPPIAAAPPKGPLPADHDPALRYPLMESLISYRPMSNAELLEATGLTTAQISTTIVNMQRRGLHVVNLGTDRKARWFLAGRPVAVR